MPSSLFSEIDHTASALEEQRALQLAFELSMLGLSEPLGSVTDNQPLGSPTGLGAFNVGVEDRSKKSQNMTECVPVPSSEHVAEIVGRQGQNSIICIVVKDIYY